MAKIFIQRNCTDIYLHRKKKKRQDESKDLQRKNKREQMKNKMKTWILIMLAVADKQ